MHFHQLLVHIGSAFQRASAYQQFSSSQESLLADIPTQPDQLGPVDSELPSYECLPPPPEYRTTATQSSTSTANIARRLARIFTRRPRDKKQAPVSVEHSATLGQIARTEDEIHLSHELQAAAERERRLESTWDVAQETCTPSELNGEFNDRMDLAEHTETLYHRLTALIGADIGPQMCLPGTPRAELVGQKLAHLRKLESLQRELADCAAKIERCEWARVCPRYSGMTAASAIKRLGELTLWRGGITSQIAAIKAKISGVNLHIEELMREYDALGA
ncbi:hypothetical protein FHL15_002594 [Xylaria flabelliformis]|uniref:Uncharacterized protein n=1 Tax=Xylaria flabelliformis TaxID=2512241 RepID=A0A553I7Z4_9PEZI|nr:hypothetical protein FHL15_002594 [Xylaria flabelliformis]